MRVLVACEFSGIVRDAFAAKGHDAWSCDLLPTERPGNHIVGDVLDYITNEWDLMIAHPPCTYLSNSGVRHLHDSVSSRNGVKAKIHGEERMEYMIRSAKFFNKFLNAPIEKICVENPTPHKYAKEIIGNYSQAIQPWQFGHGETKRTCLWLKNLSQLIPTDIVGGRHARCHLMPQSKDRGKLRSITFTGIAAAMAEQWG
jgi:hypothetical protein